MAEINFQKIEKKWQKKWEKEKIFCTQSVPFKEGKVKEEAGRREAYPNTLKGTRVRNSGVKKKYYVLEMFPYPSATGLHMGHAFNFTIGDIFARFKRMQGFNVLHPIGFDSLGLPAENAAIKAGTHPEEYTKNSIKNFVKQQKAMGWSYDWSRVVNTSNSSYYKWDQWIFLKMFERGLAYQKKAAVNWCPKCDTVLANEQAQSGKCERCESEVAVKHLKQWFFKITDYAEELLKDHDKLDWPSKTIAMQKNWIGKSHGTEINFKIIPKGIPKKGTRIPSAGHKTSGEVTFKEASREKWPIFTTRPDTIFGVTFMVISAQHLRLMELVSKEKKKDVQLFLKKLKNVSEEDLEKEGVFTGSYAINPVNGEKVPVYAGNFVVADYGSGMVMAVPAHDQRDFLFAKKYGIPIKIVIQPEDGEINLKKMSRAYVGDGKLVDSGEFNGLNNRDAVDAITDWLKKKKFGKKVVNFKLRDWCLSRQRYWGTPIPIIYCEKCGVVPVKEKDLPIKLPKKVKFGKGNPLLTNEVWVKVKCPKCGGDAKRETDTMDTFVNSSWYFLRYCDPKNSKEIFDKKKVKYWMPVDVYIGGAEHACMHLIYHRFYTKFLRDLGLIDFGEPTPRLFHQGMINAEDGEKMSKSKGNIVEPLKIVKEFGADTTRLFLVSVASPEKGFNWSESGISGSLKFINRIFSFYNNVRVGKSSKELESKLNQTIKDVTKEIEEIFGYRDAAIKLRELFAEMEKERELSKEVLYGFLKMLSPFCPHITEELWEKIEGKGFISLAKWPKVDERKIIKKGIGKVDLNKKYEGYVQGLLKKTGKSPKKIYLYVMPFELEKLDVSKIGKELGFEVQAFSTGDEKKYDPENKSKKAKPGLPGVYFE